MRLTNISSNWKFFIAWFLLLLLASPIPSEIPSFILGIIGAIFLLHLVAQRGVRVGWKYQNTFILAWIALPIVAFWVWIVKKPTQAQK